MLLVSCDWVHIYNTRSDETLEKKTVDLRRYKEVQLPDLTLKEFVFVGRDLKDWSSCDLEVDTFHAEVNRDRRTEMVNQS